MQLGEPDGPDATGRGTDQPPTGHKHETSLAAAGGADTFSRVLDSGGRKFPTTVLSTQLRFPVFSIILFPLFNAK